MGWGTKISIESLEPRMSLIYALINYKRVILPLSEPSWFLLRTTSTWRSFRSVWKTLLWSLFHGYLRTTHFVGSSQLAQRSKICSKTKKHFIFLTNTIPFELKTSDRKKNTHYPVTQITEINPFMNYASSNKSNRGELNQSRRTKWNWYRA